MESIIDAHIHIMPPERLRGLMRWIKKAFPNHPVDPRITEDGICEELRENGVKFFFNYVYPLRPAETDSLNDFNLALGERIIRAAPFGSLHIDTENKRDVVKRCVDDYKFVGMKFHPFVQGFDPADERMFVVYELMEDYARPVVLHTGFDDFYQKDMVSEVFEKILNRFPELPFVLSHAIFPRFFEAGSLMERFPNVYIDATNVFGALKLYKDHGDSEEARLSGERYGEEFRSLVLGFPKRTIFGSDHPAGMGGLEEIYRDFYEFGFPEEVMRDILWENPKEFIRRFAPHILDRWESVID